MARRNARDKLPRVNVSLIRQPAKFKTISLQALETSIEGRFGPCIRTKVVFGHSFRLS